MSYGTSAGLQAALYGVLSADASLTGLIGSHVYDGVPAGEIPSAYVVIGSEDVRDRSDQTGGMDQYRVTIGVVTEADGFQRAKEIAGAVSDALDGAVPALSRGRIINLSFERARARRVRAGQVRRIDLIFRILVDDT